MDPEIEPVVAAFPKLQFDDPAAQRRALAEARAQGPAPRPVPGVRVDTVDLPRPDGSLLPLRLYRPEEPAATTATIVWFHGGGYCIGTLEQEDPMCSELAAGTGCTVVSVGYRLAPEDPHPAALEDALLATTWAAEAAPGAAIAVAGTSAGAGLAAAVALVARDHDGPDLAFQLLLYPFLDDRLASPSIAAMPDAPVFDAADARAAWAHYLGADREDVSPYAAPARATDLRELPAAYVLAAGLDCLRDDALDYAMGLTRAGVPVELHLLPEVPHGFLSLAPDSGVSTRTKAEIVQALRRSLA